MSQFIDTRSARIHVLQAGAGAPAFLFLHYWGGSARTWHCVIDALDGRVRSIAVDQRGWGQSVAHDGRHDLEAMANDVADLIAALDLSIYVLVGHSMGGKVAQIVAMRRPAGLVGLVLVAPAPPTPMQVPAEARSAMLKSYQSREGATGALAVLTHQSLDENEHEALLSDTLGGSADAKRVWTKSGMIADLGPNISSISIPTIILVGDEDQVERASKLEEIYRWAIPQAELRVIPSVGHLSPIEAPARIAEACIDLLALLHKPTD